MLGGISRAFDIWIHKLPVPVTLHQRRNPRWIPDLLCFLHLLLRSPLCLSLGFHPGPRNHLEPTFQGQLDRLLPRHQHKIEGKGILLLSISDSKTLARDHLLLYDRLSGSPAGLSQLGEPFWNDIPGV